MRLGYACVNMTLSNPPKRSGIPRVYTARTARQATWYKAGIGKLGELALANAHDLYKILQWNLEHEIYLFRVGSELFPWHDHYELNQLPQYEAIANVLHQCGEFARAHGMRLTTHPGPFHVLGSPREDVVHKTIIGLERHSELFDLMGYPPSHDNKINIHIGGTYGNPEGTLDRWCKNWERLSSSCRARLVVENDDKPSQYSVKMLYDGVYKRLGVPITFDYFHHQFHTDGLNERDALYLAAETWPNDIRQCTHYSESRRMEQRSILHELCEKNRISYDDLDSWPTLNKIKKKYEKIKETAHSDYIVNEINTYGLDIDIVLEVKAKELALLEYRKLFLKKVA